MSHPLIIQGGMGVAVSGWRLARAVSELGQLGVVSGTALDAVLARRLQLGDPDGVLRNAAAAFPVPGVADRILDRYLVPGGKQPEDRYVRSPMGSLRPSAHLLELLVLASFVEVWLAKRGHQNPVGINFLEKIQAPTLPALYGAMLAGVDYVLVGAGIPRAFPGILDGLADGRPVEMRLDVKGAGSEVDTLLRFDPSAFCGGDALSVRRPIFLAIVSSHVLATMLARRIDPPADGFVVEYPTAGGHNAPPRAREGLNDRGEPVYGEKDAPDLAVIRDLGLPFWLAGSQATPEALSEALANGATGIQVGTAFAYCEESGLRSDIKARVIRASLRGEAEVFTDPTASPTGFPFKLVQLAGTLTDENVYTDRIRSCDLGYLRSAFIDKKGRQRWRCPAEPVDDYERKGGDPTDTEGRKCLCNALMANIGLAQTLEDGTSEPMLVTSGDDVRDVARFLPPGASTYTANNVIQYLLGDSPSQVTSS